MERQSRGRHRDGEGSWTWLPDKKLWRLRRTMDTGQRKAYYARTKAECERKAQLDAQQGAAHEPGTVAEWLTLWTENKCHTVKASTCARYRSAVTVYLLPTLGHIRLDKLTPHHITDALRAIERPRKNGTTLSGTTVRRTFDVLSNALQAAVKQGRLLSNPARVLDPPRQEHKPSVILSEAQTNQLLDAADGHPLEALFTLALRCGLREAELLGLQWKNLRSGRLDITGSLQRGYEGELRKGEPKTKSARRTISLDADSLAAIEKLTRGADDAYIFPLPGDPKWQLRKAFDALLQKAELPHMRFHDLRHTCATHLIEDGVSFYAVSHLLGHASVEVTLRIYGHLTTKQTEAATEAMNARARQRAAARS